MFVASEFELAALAVRLGARRVPIWSATEEALVRDVPRVPAARLAEATDAIHRGLDPLGQAFCALRPSPLRRLQGATYTPAAIVEAMLAWAKAHGEPARIVDAGSGSGRFLVAAARCFPSAALVGVELDPLAALLARAHAACAGSSQRTQILLADYRTAALPEIKGRTFFVGNPPYVRHHLIEPRWKAWLVETAAQLGLHASQLAGLHAHFILATVRSAKPGDFGAFITSSEWLDVNYGRLIRDLFLRQLGGLSLNVIEPTAGPFPDAATTGAIACFEIGAKRRSIRLRRVASLDELGALDGGRPVRRERLETANRWTPLTRPSRKVPAGFVELGELCRVHRGQVTGANRVWIAGTLDDPALPEAVLFSSVTRARELFAAGERLSDAATLRQVIDIPVDLDALRGEDRRQVDEFLKKAKTLGADRGYVARKRMAWWSVGLREPAPILATYMARRPPAFVRNAAQARHINIAHGLYPREPMSDALLSGLARFLSREVALSEGRTYAGGLTKFEPKEMERLLVPEPALLVPASKDRVAS